MKKFILILVLAFSLQNVNSQSLLIKDVKVDNVPINGFIDFGLKSSVIITFKVAFSKPNNLTIGNIVYHVGTVSALNGFQRLASAEEVYSGVNSTGFSATYSKEIFASQYSFGNGNYLFAKIVQLDYPNVEYPSNMIPIFKTPTYSISSNVNTVACNSSTEVQFTVNSADTSYGSSTYQWSYGPGWTLIGGTTGNILRLIPGSSTLGQITVTPTYKGAIQPTKTLTLKRPPFISEATIIGSNSICNLTETYSIDNSENAQNIVWSSSNPSIATVNNSTGNSVTVSKVGEGNFKLIATITNSCGQVSPVSKSLTAYSITSHPIPAGTFDIDFVDCYDDSKAKINFYPTTAFGGVITLSLPFLPHPSQSQTKQITVTYTNPCNGFSTSKVLTFKYTAPDCHQYKTINNSTVFSIYPNPSNELVKVSLIENNTNNNQIISGEIFDILGISKSKIKIIEGEASFSVSSLKKGIYVLKIYLENKIETHQIIVE